MFLSIVYFIIFSFSSITIYSENETYIFLHSQQAITVEGNKTATDTFMLNWNNIPKAESYNVYQVTLHSRKALISKIKKADLIKLDTTKKNSFKIKITDIPLRRYAFFVEALGSKGQIITSFTSDIVWRYPQNVEEFIQDVDFTIAHAQKQINSFGLGGSRKIVNGRAHGEYDYVACVLGSKSDWNNYSSFEIILNGKPRIDISVYPTGAVMDGVVNISGLYEGQIIYKKLFGKTGGLTSGGSILARYKHPKKGWLEQEFSYKEAAKILKSVILSSDEISRTLPFEQGKGQS